MADQELTNQKYIYKKQQQLEYTEFQNATNERKEEKKKCKRKKQKFNPISKKKNESANMKRERGRGRENK